MKTARYDNWIRYQDRDYFKDMSIAERRICDIWTDLKMLAYSKSIYEADILSYQESKFPTKEEFALAMDILNVPETLRKRLRTILRPKEGAFPTELDNTSLRVYFEVIDELQKLDLLSEYFLG